MVWKQSTNTSSVGTAAKFGAADINKYSKYLGGEADIETTDIDTSTTIRSSKFLIRNPANTFSYTFVASAIAAARNITLPLLTTNDTLVVLALAQTLTNKTIAAGSNTITGIVDANIDAHTSTKITITAKGQLNSVIVFTDQTNTFGTFNQIFPSSRLLIQNPGATFNYTLVGSAITAARNLTLPLLTGDDTLVTEAMIQTLTNKTLTSPTISTVINTGTLTLPTSTDTIVGRATTDTLTNKTLAASTISGTMTFNDAIDIVLNATTGTKIGTATTQKIGFFNKTPVVQRTGIADVNVATVDNTYGQEENDVITSLRTKVNAILQVLEDLGLTAVA